MKNITPIENDFQNSEAATVERINNLSAAIEAAPGDALRLLSASIETETDAVVKGWLIRFREALEPLTMGGANVKANQTSTPP